MTLPPPGWRRELLFALLLALVAAAFRLPRLGFPPEEVFDEVYHAKTALQYLQGEAPVEWVHPPTAKLLIAAGVKAFGYEPWAWRLAPALAGILLAPVFFLFARRVLPGERAALVAAGLLLCDGVYLVQSRVAMTNIFAVLFQVSAALFILRAGLAERVRVLDMAGVGVCLGLALSTRWTSLWAAGFLGVTFLVLRRQRLLRVREIGLALFAFAVLPASIYVLSYVPWMQQGHSLWDMVRMQGSIWNYHATLNATHPYFSRWYTWPWLVRPTWYYFDNSGGQVAGMVAIGNPALWWVSVPVSVWAVATGLRARRPERAVAGFAFALAGLLAFQAGAATSTLGLALMVAGLAALALAGLGARDPALLWSGLGFFALYLPWGLSPRTLNYSHYLFEAIPYACLTLGVLIDRLWSRGSRGPVVAYAALVVALFVLFFPFLTAYPVPADWFNRPFLFGVRPWTWFSSWT